MIYLRHNQCGKKAFNFHDYPVNGNILRAEDCFYDHEIIHPMDGMRMLCQSCGGHVYKRNLANNFLVATSEAEEYYGPL